MPEPPLVIVIQEAPLLAVHVAVDGAVSETDPVPPVAGTLADVGESEGGATPACVTPNCMPSIVSEPVRVLVEGLAATV